MNELAGRDLLSPPTSRPTGVRGLLAFAREHQGRPRARRRSRARSRRWSSSTPRCARASRAKSALRALRRHGITLAAGKDTWNFECGEGVVMDGDTQEHVRELAPVLSRMGHFVGIRVGARHGRARKGRRQRRATAELAKDEFLQRFAEFAEVPVINLESNRWHPLQGLADALTIQEKLGEPRGQEVRAHLDLAPEIAAGRDAPQPAPRPRPTSACT